jgi:aspartate aminotransferase
MRHALYDELKRLNTPGTWDHIINQIGMFSYTGLEPEQIEILARDYHIYMLKSGRISISGRKLLSINRLRRAEKKLHFADSSAVNTANVKYVAKAFDAAVRSTTTAADGQELE